MRRDRGLKKIIEGAALRTRLFHPLYHLSFGGRIYFNQPGPFKHATSTWIIIMLPVFQIILCPSCYLSLLSKLSCFVQIHHCSVCISHGESVLAKGQSHRNRDRFLIHCTGAKAVFVVLYPGSILLISLALKLCNLFYLQTCK